MPQRPKRRGTSASRGYGYRWQKARVTYLSANPLCAHCLREGRTTAATVVDHIIPHRGDQKLFWDTSNWQSLCKRHHDIKTVTEDGGFGNKNGKTIDKSVNNDGFPLSKDHPWNKHD